MMALQVEKMLEKKRKYMSDTLAGRASLLPEIQTKQ
jgi:hypothetical protein